jgi:hypothetical protein
MLSEYLVSYVFMFSFLFSSFPWVEWMRCSLRLAIDDNRKGDFDLPNTHPINIAILVFEIM